MEYSNEEINNHLKEKLIMEHSKIDNEFFKMIFDNANINKGTSSESFDKIGNTIGLLKALKVNETTGLMMDDNNDIKHRKHKWGTNEISHKMYKSFNDFFTKIIHNRIFLLILFFSVFYIVFGVIFERYRFLIKEGLSIMISLLIINLISTFNNLNKQSYDIDNKSDILSCNKIIVLRNSSRHIIKVSELLVGDIIYIKQNDLIPVDCILLSGYLEMQESAITGVNEIIKKFPNESIYDSSKEKLFTPFLYSGTKVITGEASAIVCSVGKFTVIGRIQKQIADSGEKTALTKKLRDIGNMIYDIVFISALVIFIILNFKHLVFSYFSFSGELNLFKHLFYNVDVFHAFINSLIISITVLLVILPEKLHYVFSLTLAYTIMKLKQEGIIVRKLDVCDTLGGVNNICTDMVGTLTQGKMIVRNIYIEKVNISNTKMKMSEGASNVFRSNIINNISQVLANENYYLDESKLQTNGDMIDLALYNYFVENKWNLSEYQLKKIMSLEVVSDSRTQCNICLTNDENAYKLFVKGSYNDIFHYCSFYLDSSGLKELSETTKNDFKQIKEMYLITALTPVFICEKNIHKTELDDYLKLKIKSDEILKDLSLIGVLGISDLPRKELITPIKKLINSGITIRIITGENIKIAISMAKELGIITPDDATFAINRLRISECYNNVNLTSEYIDTKEVIALEGDEFRNLTKGYSTRTIENLSKKKIIEYSLKNEYLFSHYSNSLKIIARASPDDRFLIVLGLKQKGEIVAVTGKAIKDGPALKKADVGFALGKVSTEIAKEAADIVIENNNFSSILLAIKYGRNVYETLKRFLQFELIIIIVAITIILISSVILDDCALNSMKLLWVNLLVDTFASIAISTDPPTDQILDKPPYKKQEFPIKKNMVFNIVSQAFYQILLLLIIIFYGDNFFSVRSDKDLRYDEWTDLNGYHYTIVFNLFVYFQIFSSFNSRFLFENNGEFYVKLCNGSGFFLIQFLFIIIHIILITYGGDFFRTKPLDAHQHLSCFILAISIVPFAMIINSINYEDLEEKKKDEINHEEIKSLQNEEYLRPLLKENSFQFKRRFTTLN